MQFYFTKLFNPSMMREEVEVKTDWNYFYKKGYDAAFLQKGEGEPGSSEKGFISGFNAGKAIYKFYKQ